VLHSARGALLKRYDYDAFGCEINPELLDANPFRFCGEYFDREAQGYYLRNQDYTPSNGRFTREDPIRSGLNWYAYCGGNPVRFVDPSGLRYTDYAVQQMTAKAQAQMASAEKARQNAAAQVARVAAMTAAGNAYLTAQKTKNHTAGGFSSIDQIWDPITANRINQLHPDIRTRVTGVILEAQARDINLRVTDAYRAIDEQNADYQKGRRGIPGEGIVTHARGGYSYHNYGLAFDVVQMVDGMPVYADTPYDTIGGIGKKWGFEWGGDWPDFLDMPHFQETFGYTPSELLALTGTPNNLDSNGYLIFSQKHLSGR
jgi:peptidoglycan L-alanyl-D-glutamate endopeptidase CwlK